MTDIVVPREKIVDLARFMERLVVSEDRIGAWYAAGAGGDADKEAGRWYRESGLLRTASSLRVDLFALLGHYDPVDGDDDEVIRVEEAFDRELGDVGYWSPQLREETSDESPQVREETSP